MAVVSIKSNASRPSVAELVARATAIAPFVRAEAEQTENNRQVSAEAMARLREAGLFRVMTPAVYGGYEYGFDALIRDRGADRRGVRLDGLGVQPWHRPSVASRAMFPKQAQDEFWSNPDAMLFGSYPPVGKVVAGRWRLSALRQLEFHQRLRSRAVAGARRHDPAARRRRAADAGVLSGADLRCSHRRQLVHHGPCRHRQQKFGDGQCLSCRRIASCRSPICARARRPAPRSTIIRFIGTR